MDHTFQVSEIQHTMYYELNKQKPILKWPQFETPLIQIIRNLIWKIERTE